MNFSLSCKKSVNCILYKVANNRVDACDILLIYLLGYVYFIG